MTTNASEGNSNSDEGGTPIPTLPEDSQPSSGDLSELKSAFDVLVKKYDAQEATIRALQSGKDKDKKRDHDEIENIKARIDEILALKEKGLDAEEIETRLQVRALLAGRTLPPEPSAGTEAQGAVSVEAMLGFVKDAGLSDNDPEVLQLMTAKAPAEAYYKLKIRKLQPPAPDASGVQPVKPEGTSKKDEAALLAGYSNEMLAARGKPNELRAIKAKYQKEGLPVDQVVLPV